MLHLVLIIERELVNNFVELVHLLFRYIFAKLSSFLVLNLLMVT